ncbi:MAG: hypothetical protein KIH63_005590 [Candidatus Saccharibacteria bacterium]|nr:hypothetical protein [Candidatus Saccharibacteria bacterium]
MSAEESIYETLFNLPGGEIDTFIPKPARPDSFDEPRLSPGAIYGVEMIHAREGASDGHWDVAAGIKGVVAGGILEIIQTDLEAARAQGDKISSNWFVQMADLPVDWKAVATAGAAFALTSGARRATKPFTVGADIKRALEAARTAESSQAHTLDSYRRFRRLRTLREGVVTIAATGGAYELGTQLTPQQNLLAGVALAAVTATKVVVDKAGYTRRGY